MERRGCAAKKRQISSLASNARVGLAAPAQPGCPPGQAWPLAATLWKTTSAPSAQPLQATWSDAAVRDSEGAPQRFARDQ